MGNAAHSGWVSKAVSNSRVRLLEMHTLKVPTTSIAGQLKENEKTEVNDRHGIVLEDSQFVFRKNPLHVGKQNPIPNRIDISTAI